MHGQLVQDVAGRCDRIGAVDHRNLRALRCRQDSPGEGAIAGHGPVESRRHLGRLDGVVLAEDLRRLAEGVARLEHAGVGLRDVLVLGEPLLDPRQRRFERPRVDPGDQAQREEVLGPVLLLRVERQVLDGLVGEARHVDLVQPIALPERRLVERVRGVPGLVEVALVERLGVDDEEPARLEVPQMDLGRGRVHCDQTVEPITGGVDALTAELQLEARDPEERPGRCTNLGGEVRERGEVVARPRRLGRELFPGELHAVTGIPGEPDHGAVQRFSRLLDACGGSRYPAHPCRVSSLILRSHIPRARCGKNGPEGITDGRQVERRQTTVILSEAAGAGKIPSGGQSTAPYQPISGGHQPASTSWGCLIASPGRRFRTSSGNRPASQPMTSFTVTTPIGRPSGSTSGIVR